MAARAGMANVITELRALTNASASDFSDDTLQDILDDNRHEHSRIELRAIPDYAAGAYTYTRYPLPDAWYEESGSGSGWSLLDSEGDAAPSYTVNYRARMITFASDTEDALYYLDCRTYDMNMSAARVWRRKAAAAAANIDWKSDNHDVKASQEYTQCLEMAEYFIAESMRGLWIVEMFRGDM